MRYNLQATKQFEKDVHKLPKIARERVLNKITRLKTTPYSFKVLHGNLKGKYSLRAGDYRVIYTINESEKVVTLYCVGHRGVVYER